MTTISLEGMRFYGYHGLYPSEKELGNEFIIDVHIEIDTFDGDDSIEDTLNYEVIYEICKNHMESRYKLLESIAKNITTDFVKEFKEAKVFRIKISKLNPPIPGELECATVTHIVENI